MTISFNVIPKMKNNRRSFLTKAAALGLASTIPFQIKSRPKAKELPSLKGRKVLFTYGGWDGHEPLKYRDYMGDWLKNEGAEVTLSDSLDSYLDKELMTSVDLIIQLYTMSQITNEQEKGLVEAVKAAVRMLLPAERVFVVPRRRLTPRQVGVDFELALMQAAANSEAHVLALHPRPIATLQMRAERQ